MIPKLQVMSKDSDRNGRARKSARTRARAKTVLKTDSDRFFSEQVTTDRSGEWSFSANTPGAIGWTGSVSNSVRLIVRQQTIDELLVSNQMPLTITIVAEVIMGATLGFRLRRKKRSDCQTVA